MTNNKAVGLICMTDLVQTSSFGWNMACSDRYHYNRYLSIDFYDLSTLVGCWSSASIRRITNYFLRVCPFHCTTVAVSGKVAIPKTG